MGIIFSRYRRKKSTDEILEELQSDIQSLEDNREQTLQRQKYWIGRLYIYSIILYIVIASTFYFCFFPVSLADRVFYIIPLLGFPVIVYLLKKFITWYYKREIVHGKDKLSELKARKKKILEDVMNKETYKIAKEILEKYAPEQVKKKESSPRVTLHSPTHKVTRQLPQQPPMTKGPGPPVLALTAAPGMHTPLKTQGPMVLQRQPSPQRRLVRPIIPRERNFIDKVIESLIGDGPSNRYALICRNCASHNGMALKEEFEYLAFRCAYCGFPNPAHKVRPRASVQLHERAPSEDRKSVDGSKVEGADEDDRSVDGESVKDSSSTQGEDKGNTEANIDPPSTANSSDESSTPVDGVRPRKPLVLAND